MIREVRFKLFFIKLGDRRDEIKNQRKKKSKDDDEFSKKPFDDD